ncbi:hypothetical protein cce_0667 [Crocosphaera subtropica ATCC 51142]|uniref:Uncharacterized protein n=1 Tax=Crocosphaera subtropica (strain ATCC 51142 / BH68) TaxID=43989 RepID=B1WQ96_CROS5|nr:hypothetical protein [Crocosphaera subtropica]ACB50018.1 hypothetical protein cce_0667 [Crocosphaera subtropica ATCC 51142]
MTIVSEKQIYTPEEYLKLEEESIEKSEKRCFQSTKAVFIG